MKSVVYSETRAFPFVNNPEFTLMELYQAYTDYKGMMDITEEMFRTVAQNVLGTTKITYGGYDLDLGQPFARITMTDAVKQVYRR